MFQRGRGWSVRYDGTVVVRQAPLSGVTLWLWLRLPLGGREGGGSGELGELDAQPRPRLGRSGHEGVTSGSSGRDSRGGRRVAQCRRWLRTSTLTGGFHLKHIMNQYSNPQSKDNKRHQNYKKIRSSKKFYLFLEVGHDSLLFSMGLHQRSFALRNSWGGGFV